MITTILCFVFGGIILFSIGVGVGLILREERAIKQGWIESKGKLYDVTLKP